VRRSRPRRLDAARSREFALRGLARRGALTPDDEQMLRRALAEPELLPAGSELISEGALLERPCLILEGWAARQRILSDGRRQIFSFVLPGDAIGLCARPDGRALYGTVALTAVIVAPVAPLGAALKGGGSPALSHVAGAMLALAESSMLKQIVRLGSQSAHERLANLLLEFYYRLEQVGLAEEGSFVLPFTQEVLSDALGLSVVHTNRTLQSLRREKLIETKGPMVTLVDLASLARIADWAGIYPPWIHRGLAQAVQSPSAS
jgi:CRP-like cAMP-binding protein